MPPVGAQPVSADDAVRAAAAIDGLVRDTPMVASGELSRRVGAPVSLKAESLQLTGSFKIRGASYKLSRLGKDERAAGVVAASAGNHAQAVALAARRLGVASTLCMPEGAALAKVAAVRQYGGEVRFVPGSFEEAGEVARELADQGMTLVPAFDDPSIVAGQGTLGLEIAAELPDARVVVVPLGGGGLASGIAIAVKSRLDDVRVIGVQAEGFAPYMSSIADSRQIGAPSARTIADGIAIKRPGELTLPLVERYVDDVVTVSDDEIATAMVLLVERAKLVVEGAGAAAVAALMHGRVPPPSSGSVCAVVSGGNVDASLLAECIRLGETAASRRIVLTTVLPDRPGALAGMLRVVAAQGANVVDVEHLRDGVDLHVRETAIQLVLQTDGSEHCERLLEAVREEGFSIRVQSQRPA